MTAGEMVSDMQRLCKNEAFNYCRIGGILIPLDMETCASFPMTGI